MALVLRPYQLRTLDTAWDAFQTSCLALAKDALDDFSASRAREGEKLAAVILERVARMRELVRDVAPRIPVARRESSRILPTSSSSTSSRVTMPMGSCGASTSASRTTAK